MDFLTKTKKKNEGEVPQYFVENSHPAIISPETFDLVQSELRRRTETGHFASADPFAGKIFCAECGSMFGSKVWHSTSKYRKTVWRCNAKYKQGKRGGPQCQITHITEDDLKSAFVVAYNQLLGDKDRYIDAFDEVMPIIADTSTLEKEAVGLTEERDVVSELIRKCVEGNARTKQDQDEYRQKYEGLVTRYETVHKRLEEITAEKQDRAARKERIRRFLDTLRKADGLLAEFDETLWHSTVDRVTVRSATEMTFTFRDENEIQVNF